MPESIVEQILANVKTQLEAIVSDRGANWWYTPDAVARVDRWDTKYLDMAKGEVIYLVRNTGDERPADQDHWGSRSRELDVFVLVAKRDDRADVNPYIAKAPLSGTIRNRMIRDVEKKLYTDITRGGVALSTDVREPNRDQAAAGWVVAEIPVTVTFVHTKAAP